MVFHFKEIAMTPNIYHIESRKYCTWFRWGIPSHASMKIRDGGWIPPLPRNWEIQIKITEICLGPPQPQLPNTLHHPRKHKYPSDSLWKKIPGSMHASLYRVCRIFCRLTIEPAYLTQNPTPLLESTHYQETQIDKTKWPLRPLSSKASTQSCMGVPLHLISRSPFVFDI